MCVLLAISFSSTCMAYHPNGLRGNKEVNPRSAVTVSWTSDVNPEKSVKHRKFTFNYS